MQLTRTQFILAALGIAFCAWLESNTYRDPEAPPQPPGQVVGKTR